MQDNEQGPVVPPPRRAPARPTPRNSGGLSLGKVVAGVAVLLVAAYFLGNRKAPGTDAGQTTQAEATADAPRPTARPDAVVIQGEKSTTLATVDDARMSVGDQGRVLRIEGSVGRNFARSLQAALDANPSLQRIDIQSGGGYAQPGLEAARMIQRRNLTVRVHSHCASMCVALWAAAPQRELEPDAVIGLHQWNPQCDALPSPAREECHYQVQFATDHDASYDAWLRAAGFNQRLLDLQTTTAAEDIAVLAAPQLWDNGVRFNVVDGNGARMDRDAVMQYLAARSARR